MFENEIYIYNSMGEFSPKKVDGQAFINALIFG